MITCGLTEHSTGFTVYVYDKGEELFKIGSDALIALKLFVNYHLGFLLEKGGDYYHLFDEIIETIKHVVKVHFGGAV